jgi:hypothetical protein
MLLEFQQMLDGRRSLRWSVLNGGQRLFNRFLLDGSVTVLNGGQRLFNRFLLDGSVNRFVLNSRLDSLLCTVEVSRRLFHLLCAIS